VLKIFQRMAKGVMMPLFLVHMCFLAQRMFGNARGFLERAIRMNINREEKGLAARYVTIVEWPRRL
jgi:hypothetical protein